jgi:hypothetical protein
MGRMPLGGLSQAWVTAEACLPLGWLLLGLTRDPQWRDKWTAVAIGPLHPIDDATGKGDQLEKALLRLADALRERGIRRRVAPLVVAAPNGGASSCCPTLPP